MAPIRPAFSGLSPCPKCLSLVDKQRVVTYGRTMQAPNGRLMHVTVAGDPKDPHLIRSCPSCGWEWEERCADDPGDGTGAIREAR